MLIHRTPDAEASGGGEAAVEKPKVEVVAKVEPKPEPKGRVVSDEEYAALVRARDFQADAEKARKQAEEDKLRDKGKWEEIVKARETERDAATARATDLEARTKRSVLGKELASALAEQPLVKGAASQLAKLWSDEFEVTPAGDDWSVTTRDRKSPAEFVKAMLASDEFAHFVKAAARGGAGGGGDKSQPTNQGEAPKPGSLEAVAARWKADQKNYGAMGLPGFGTK